MVIDWCCNIFYFAAWVASFWAASKGPRKPQKPITKPDPPKPARPRYAALYSRHHRALTMSRWLDCALDQVILSDARGDSQAFQLACMDARRVLRVYATTAPEEVG